MNIKLLSTFLFALLLAPRPVHAATVREQFKASVAELQKSPNDKALREKIIKLALKLKPKPAVPEEAERRMARGRAAVKAAKDKEGFQDAAREYEKAALAAPWLAEAYYNRGIVLDKADDYAGAMKSLKLYLLAAPGARNAKKVKTLVYELEYKQEKAEKKKHEEEGLRATVKSLRHKLRGTYDFGHCNVGYGPWTCNEKEYYGGKHWIGSRPWDAIFSVLDNGLILLRDDEREPTVNIIGIPDGPLLKNVRWISKKNLKDPKNTLETEGKTIWVEVVAEDGSVIIMSKNRPLDPALFNPKTGYEYVSYSRR